ncbi:MAG: multidrug ABC transporter ATP-binding protein [Vicingaceae bacterium]|nr:MAG: multidrug ABC transporter ATP-binding protein [Vicingaceae bacterium]GIV42074.1 MAG: multidrug ABC transporter ATP-binding protein [Vicingaceae bacterium]
MKLEIKQISKTYQNNLKALDNVSLTLTTGMFGLLGPNGAGKSTLMRILSTLIAPDSGEIYLNDENVTDKPWKIKSILGYLPQEFGVYPKTTAIELLTHIAVLKGIVNKRREIAGQLLHMVNLYEHRNRYVYDFSGGMRQRFGIAQALMGDPKILIVDEPTAGLDPTERNRFQNILADVAKERIVLFSTHIVQDISDLCNKMAVLHKGRVKFEGSPADALKLIENKVYEKQVESSEIQSLSEQYNILSYKLKYGQHFISIFSEDFPGKDFKPKQPDLEDVFFYMCNVNE